LPPASPGLRPGRPREFTRIERAEKSPKAGALRDPKKRGWLFHTFMHHELQAAELMAWAIVAYPDTPAAFRRGLANILLDEVRHMVMYREALESLGCTLGEFGVRDWFWQRVPAAKSPAEFCAVMGLGLEAANLDHSRRYAQWLREAGDARGAELQSLVAAYNSVHLAVVYFTQPPACSYLSAPETLQQLNDLRKRANKDLGVLLRINLLRGGGAIRLQSGGGGGAGGLYDAAGGLLGADDSRLPPPPPHTLRLLRPNQVPRSGPPPRLAPRRRSRRR
jgi:hypothetical protein